MPQSREAELWRTLIPLVESFEPLHRHGDRFWEFFVSIKRKWRRFTVTRYQGTYHFFAEDFGPVLVDPEKTAAVSLEDPVRKTLTALAVALEGIRERVGEDAIEYHRGLTRSLSPRLRYGVIARPFTRELLPDFQRYDRELKRREQAKIVAILEDYPDGRVASMTADRYFDYCAVAYRANPKTFGKDLHPELSGRALYERFADGRDGGLLELPGGSEEAFRDWLESDARQGAHPWEIYRGGNATHIDLHVTQDVIEGGFHVVLDAFSSTRLVECCRIALAFHEHGHAFEMAHRESYLSRLLEQDWVGVVPEGESLRDGWQALPSELGVADCVHFDWFLDPEHRGEAEPLSKSKIAAVISWLPIRPLALRRR